MTADQYLNIRIKPTNEKAMTTESRALSSCPDTVPTSHSTNAACHLFKYQYMDLCVYAVGFNRDFWWGLSFDVRYPVFVQTNMWYGSHGGGTIGTTYTVEKLLGTMFQMFLIKYTEITKTISVISVDCDLGWNCCYEMHTLSAKMFSGLEEFVVRYKFENVIVKIGILFQHS